MADKAQALKDARTKAVADAQAQAQELAEAAGVSLGEIQTINFYENSASPVDMGKGGGGVAYDAASAVPIQPGQLTVSVNVNLTYSIK